MSRYWQGSKRRNEAVRRGVRLVNSGTVMMIKKDEEDIRKW